MKLLLACTMLLLSQLSYGVDDAIDTQDDSGITRYPFSVLVQQKRAEVQGYRWVLGALEKVNGRLVVEKEKRLAGTLQRLSYRIPAHITAEEAFSFVRNQLGKERAEYQCSGRACGSSNEWANKIFHYSKLYGVERSQRYGAWQHEGRYISLYAVRRGNKQVLLHVDILETHDAQTVEVTDKKENPRYLKRMLPIQASDKALIDFLNSHSSKNFWLVVYSQAGNSIAESITIAEGQAHSAKKVLVDAHFNGQRFIAKGLGQLPNGFAETENNVLLIVPDRDVP